MLATSQPKAHFSNFSCEPLSLTCRVVEQLEAMAAVDRVVATVAVAMAVAVAASEVLVVIV